MIKLLYFARFRDALDCAGEQLPLPAHIDDIAGLVAHLGERGKPWRDTLGGARVLVAINQEVADFDAPVKEGDEVAFFPPVTGG